ncbi:O-antigen ligase family protein [Candidatus Daviesbacteria bacterium]|nr:O-antigen ligase family protein [Candidatus Daviesbacteria bacterium]
MLSAQKIITWAFFILFFFTPLFFTPFNNELFEYNKMMLVYGLTVVITGTWLLKMIKEKTVLLKRTPLDIPLLLFWLSQLLSTIFSIDPHTSVWGYYSRSNGGLLSITAYILLYFAFVANFEAKDVSKFLKSVLLGGFLVSLYAIPEHFGVSPSCIILTGSATANCWVQDVQARVFATLGQPNWLAAYLAMIIFPALYFFLTAKTKIKLVTGYLLLVTLYLAFTFTYSRGGTLGFLAGLGIFILVYVLSFWKEYTKGERPTKSKIGKVSLRIRFSRFTSFRSRMTPIFVILLTFLLINLFFGSTLYRFKLINLAAITQKTTSQPAAPAGVTQLENGGSESSQIRLIVWKGAVDIFKRYPIFGSGVETFAYSYYNFRPAEHNNVSEWDFLYNKAHNEYLNYLATTGLVGFLSYMIVTVTFILWSILRILNYKQSFSQNQGLLSISLFAAYISYLVQNFFGFSVVIIAVFFYLFPALAFVGSEKTHPLNIKPIIQNPAVKFLLNLRYKMVQNIFVKSAVAVIWIILVIYLALTLILMRVNFAVVFALLIFTIFLPKKFNLQKVTVFIIIFSLLSQLLIFYFADFFYKKGSDLAELGNAGQSYNYLVTASRLNKDEPLYHADLGFAAASASVALLPDDATTSARLKDEAAEEIETALNLSPKNVSLWRTVIRIYYALAEIDKKYNDKTIEALDKSIALAPTDAKLYYNKGLVLAQNGKNNEGLAALQKATGLKPNYWEAYFASGTIYKETGEKDKAIEEFEKVLKIFPNEPETVNMLDGLKK